MMARAGAEGWRRAVAATAGFGCLRSNILQRKSVGLRHHAAEARDAATVLDAESRKGQHVILRSGPAPSVLIGYVMDRVGLESDRSRKPYAAQRPKTSPTMGGHRFRETRRCEAADAAADTVQRSHLVRSGSPRRVRR